MMHICNSSIGEAEAGGPQVEGQPGRLVSPSIINNESDRVGDEDKDERDGADLWMGREGRRKTESEEETMTG